MNRFRQQPGLADSTAGLDILGYVLIAKERTTRWRIHSFRSGATGWRIRSWLGLGLSAALLAGCSSRVKNAADAAYEARKAQQQKVRAAAHDRDEARQQLEQVPPPAKSRYLAVHTQENWQNPFLVVGHDSVNLRVIYPDQGQGDGATGGLLRPSSARRQEMEVRLADLPKALAAIPENAWPYGRVIAVEEGATRSKPERPQIRRNVETTIQILNDLGIVVDEWTGPTGSLLR